MEVSYFEQLMAQKSQFHTASPESCECFTSFASDYGKICWILDNFTNFTLDTTRNQAYILMNHALLKHIQYIQQEHISIFHGILFTFSLQNYGILQEQTKESHAEALASFVLLIFPDIWQSAFSDIVETGNLELIDRFLKYFFKILSTPKPQALVRYAHVKESLDQDYIQSIIFQRMQEKSPNAFEALAYYSYSLPLQWIYDESLVGTYGVGKDEADLCAQYIHILSVLLSVLDEESRVAVYENFGIPEILSTLIQQEDASEDLLIQGAQLLVTCGKLIPDDSENQNEIALYYLNYPNDKISVIVAPLICQHIYNHSEFVSQIFQVACQKLVSFYTNNHIPNSTIYQNTYVRLITNCFKQNNEDATRTFSEIFDSDDVNSKLPLLATLFLIITDAADSKMNVAPVYSKIEEYFETMLSISDPIDEESYAIFYNFMKIAFSCTALKFIKGDDNSFTNLTTMIERLINSIFAEGIDETIQANLLKLLVQILKKTLKQLPIPPIIPPESIVSLCSEMRPTIIEAVAPLQSSLGPEVASQVFSEIFTNFLQVKTSENEAQVLKIITKYIMQSPPYLTQQFAEQIITLVQENLPQYVDNHDVGSDLIQCILFAGMSGFDYYCELLQSFETFQAYLPEFAFLAFNYLKNIDGVQAQHAAQDPQLQKIQDRGWTDHCIMVFTPVFLERIQTYLISFPEISTLLSMRKLIQYCFFFYKIVIHFIPIEIIEQLIPVIKELLEVFFENTEIFMFCIDFLCEVYEYRGTMDPSVVSQFQNMIVQQFTKRSFLFLLNPNFDPNLNKSERFLNTISKLHSKFGKPATLQMFHIYLEEAFTSFGAPPEDEKTRYLASLSRPIADRWPILRQFYADLLIYRSSFSWKTGTDPSLEEGE